jgi:hypothetical protein
MFDKSTTLSPDETLALINETARAKGDTFRVRVARRASPSSQPVVIATLEDAIAEHFVMPETWLPPLAGGGFYFLHVYHSSSDLKNTPIGSPLPINAQGTPRNIDPSAVSRSDWTGPRTLIYPVKPSENPADFTVSLGGGNDRVPQPSAGASFQGPSIPPGTDPAIAQQLLRDARETELRRMEATLMEERKRLEIETVKKEAEFRLKASEEMRRDDRTRLERLERELIELRRAPTATPSNPNHFEELVARMAPLALEFFKQASEQRQFLIKQQMDVAAQSEKASREMMQAILSRPVVDPALVALLKREEPESSKYLTPMIEAIGMMSQTTMNILSSAAELGLAGRSEEPHPAMQVIREGIKAFGAFAAMNQSANLNQAAALNQLPQAQTVVEPLRTPAETLRAAEPPRVVESPPRKAPEVRTVPTQRRPFSAIEKIVTLIKTRGPAKIAAAEIIRLLPDPDLQEEFAKTGGDFQALFGRYLAEWWKADSSNLVYTKEVVIEVVRQGVASGIFDESVLSTLDELAHAMGPDSADDSGVEEEDVDEELDALA